MISTIGFGKTEGDQGRMASCSLRPSLCQQAGRAAWFMRDQESGIQGIVLTFSSDDVDVLQSNYAI